MNFKNKPKHANWNRQRCTLHTASNTCMQYTWWHGIYVEYMHKYQCSQSDRSFGPKPDNKFDQSRPKIELGPERLNIFDVFFFICSNSDRKYGPGPKVLAMGFGSGFGLGARLRTQINTNEHVWVKCTTHTWFQWYEEKKGNNSTRRMCLHVFWFKMVWFFTF